MICLARQGRGLRREAQSTPQGESIVALDFT
jgi:hypothetical protein